MKKPFNLADLAKLTLTAASVLVLTACFDSDDDSAPAEEAHEHSLLISQSSNTALSLVEEEGLETLEGDAAAVGAKLLLADNGEAAAILTNGSVQFVAEHHEEGAEAAGEEHHLPEISSLTITGTDVEVANTKGHFSVLVDGTTQLVAYEALEGEAPVPEEVEYSADEEFPALILDEEHDLFAVFYQGGVMAHEGTETPVTLFSCGVLVSVIQSSEFAVVSCNNPTDRNHSIKVAADHSVTATDLGINHEIEWKTRANVFVGLGVNNDIFYVLEENAQEALEEESSFTKPTGMCDAWGIDSVNADIFALTVTPRESGSGDVAKLVVLNHDGSEQVTLELDESPNATCSTLTMTTANELVYVIDNASSKLYEIDIEDEGGEPAYHIHERIDLDVNDVASAVSFHEVGSEDGHSH